MAAAHSEVVGKKNLLSVLQEYVQQQQKRRSVISLNEGIARNPSPSLWRSKTTSSQRVTIVGLIGPLLLVITLKKNTSFHYLIL